MPSPPTRRHLLSGSSAALLLGALTRPAGSNALEGREGLASIARKQNRYFGAAVQSKLLKSDDAFRAAVLNECGWLTPELELKWAAIEPARGEITLDAMDAFSTFASDHGLRIHGHALLWHNSIPGWAQETLSDAKDWSIIRRYFASIIPRYGDTIDQWDVVNEPIDAGTRMDGLREGVLLKAFGPDYIRRALEEARVYAPHARLMINDFGFEYDSAGERNRRRHFLRLLESLKGRGAPIDGVGLQCHLDLEKGPFVARSYAAFLREIASFGLRIVITELDVKEHEYAVPVQTRDRAVADAVSQVLDVALQEPAVDGVICWGLSDRYSWLKVTDADYARYPGVWKDGGGPGLNRGLPLDASLNRKQMYGALASALNRARPRPR